MGINKNLKRKQIREREREREMYTVSYTLQKIIFHNPLRHHTIQNNDLYSSKANFHDIRYHAKGHFLYVVEHDECIVGCDETTFFFN